MKTISVVLNDQLIEALGWTLVHSIWQISLIAILLALLLVLLHRKKAALRFNVIGAGLLAIAVLSVITFRNNYDVPFANQEFANQLSVQKSESETSANTSDFIPAKTNKIENITSFFGDYFERNLPFIVTIWFICMVVLLIRYLGGLAWMLRIKAIANPVEERFQELVYRLSIQLKVNRIVRVAESVHIKSPGVLGHFKPIILTPISFLSGLTEDEVRAILLHELAHVKRNDFFFSFIQNLLETFFFYHPAIWWMTGSLNIEREHACDDLAVENGANNYVLAKTLGKVSVLAQTSTIAMAFSGKRNQIKQRIQRLIKTENMKTNLKAKLVSTFVLLVVVGTMSFTFQKKEQQELKTEVATIDQLQIVDNDAIANNSPELELAEKDEIIPSNSVVETDSNLKHPELSEQEKTSYINDEEGSVFFTSLMKQGAKKWNAYRKSHPDINFETVLKESTLINFDLRKFNLSNVNLKEAILNGTDFSEANLENVNLKEATLTGAKFIKAKMLNVNLKETILIDCDFSGADLQGTNLKEADFSNANFSKTDLRGVDLHEATTQNANFKGAIVDHTTQLPPKFDLTEKGVIVK